MTVQTAPTADTATSGAALLRARRDDTRIAPALVQPASRREAYAIQDTTLATLGKIGGWKVGARGPGVEPTCAPLPAAGLLDDGVRLNGAAWRLRGIEVEVGFELGADLPPRDAAYTLDDVARAVRSVLPVVEVVESRFTDWLGAGADSQLADLLSHGALVLGRRQPFAPRWFDLAQTEAELRFDDQVVAHTVGGHPSKDVGALLVWLANHASARGPGLAAGQVITTGSCTGMLFASPGTTVHAQVGELSPMSLSFSPQS
jgi:2-keto-4-pentenoate hydratase